MDDSFLVSAGIEKFYTFTQFFTVVCLALSLLLTLLLTVFILSRGRGHGRSLFFLLMSSFALLQCSETGLVMSPDFSTLKFWIIGGSAGLFLFSRTFLLFCRGARGPVSVCAALEAAVYLALALAPPETAPFFQIMSFNRLQPGPLYYLFLAESLGWIGAAIILLLQSGGGRKGRVVFILGGAFFGTALFLHHLLFIDHGGLILPAGCLLTAVCWHVAFIRYNYLGIFLDTFEGVLDRIRCLVILLDRNGEVMALEGNGPAYLKERTFSCVNELASCFEGSMFPDFVRGRGFDEPFTGLITLDAQDPPGYLSYMVRPVRYWRKNVAWLLSFRDVSEEERDIQDLARQEEMAALAYRDLQLYRKAGFYLEIEKEQKSLIEGVHRTLDSLRDELERGMTEDKGSAGGDIDLDTLIGTARRGLAEIRMLVNRLKNLRRGHWND